MSKNIAKKLLFFCFIAEIICIFTCFSFFQNYIIKIASLYLNKDLNFGYWKRVISSVCFCFGVIVFFISLFPIQNIFNFSFSITDWFSLTVILFFLLSNTDFTIIQYNTGGIDRECTYDFGDLFLCICRSDIIGSTGIGMGPLFRFLFRIMFRMIPTSLNDIELNILNTQCGIWFIFVYTFLSVVPFALICFKVIKGNNLTKTLFTFAIFLTWPFIFGYVRGNTALITCWLLISFCFGIQSKNPFIQECSCFMLGLAFANKLYPAVFGILLLKDRITKEKIYTIIRCCGYAIFLLVFPILFFDSPVDIIKEFMIFVTGYKNQGDGANLSLTYCANQISIIFTNSSDSFHMIYIFLILIFILSFILFFFKSKKYWHLTYMCALACIWIPTISMGYTKIYYLIPLIFLLNLSDKNIWDYCSLICLTCDLLFITSGLPVPINKFFNLLIWYFPFFILIFIFMDNYENLLKSQKKILNIIEKKRHGKK